MRTFTFTIPTRPCLAMPIERPKFYSPLSDTQVTHGHLPHWEQDGATVFVTFRLADSLPREKRDELKDLEDDWLAHHPEPWDSATVREHAQTFGSKFHAWLDEGYGSCWMLDEAVASVVVEIVQRGDGRDYRLYAFVVMANHVHVLFMPLAGKTVSEIVRSWKSVSSHAINKRLSRAGKVWQRESFDRYVRDGAQFVRTMQYIRRNDPSRAWSAFGSWSVEDWWRE